MSIIICLLVTILRVTENCIWNRIFMLSQIYASIGSFLPQPMKQRSLNYQNLLQLLWKSFLCRLFFQMIEINYVPIYTKINHIFFVIKGQFPVTDYIPNTIILYFIVHCIYVLRIFYCITCLCLSLTPPVSGLRCIVFNKVLFCSVLFCSVSKTYRHCQSWERIQKVLSEEVQLWRFLFVCFFLQLVFGLFS